MLSHCRHSTDTALSVHIGTTYTDSLAVLPCAKGGTSTAVTAASVLFGHSNYSQRTSWLKT
jgi:hypothetical protein